MKQINSLQNTQPLNFGLIVEVFKNFSRLDLFKYFMSIFSQSILALLDLLGAALLGIVVTHLSGANNDILDRFWAAISKFSSIFMKFENDKLYFLIGIAIFSFALKVVLLSWISNKTLNFLARRDAIRSAFEFNKFYTGSNPAIGKKSILEITNGLTGGVTGLIVRLASSLQNLIIECTLILVFALYLLYLQNFLLFLLTAFFSLITLLLHFFLGKKSQETMKNSSFHLVAAQESVHATFQLHRELLLAEGLKDFELRFASSKQLFALNTAKNVWLSSLPKHFYELGLYFSLFLAAIITSKTVQPTFLIAEIGIALVVISRIIPSLLRLTSSILSMRSAAGQFALLENLQQANSYGLNSSRQILISEHNPTAGIVLENLCFKYDDDQVLRINDLSYSLSFGKSLAIVGESGTGKSTLADLLCGFLQPTSGKISIEGLNPNFFRKVSQQNILLVPQKPYLIKGSVRNNIELFLNKEISKSRLEEIITAAHITEFIEGRDDGIEYQLGTDGQGLSGGQKQRIAIARALAFGGRYLIFDEATNALGNELEVSVTSNILEIRKNLTTIFITHKKDVANLCDEILDLTELI
jgi:ABC-type bacteriocin/lantibiotic exporter with double-glycine peptidase domain